MRKTQLKIIGSNVARLIHYSCNWNFILTDDEVEQITKAFKKELQDKVDEGKRLR